MKINSYTKDEVVVLEPAGKLMGGPDVGELDEKLYALLGKGQKKVILDLRKTAWISSSAIMILIHHYSKFKGIGGNLKLANLTRKIQEIIAITKLTLVFEVYDTLEAALDSFKK
jgi:anti-sigma B factor antagonist